MNAIQRMGVLYGKLGMATESRILEARASGVKAAADAMQPDNLHELLRHIFGLKLSQDQTFLLPHFTASDPTFDAQPADKEVALLAGAVAAYEMENETSLSGDVALCVLAASFGGIRPPLIDDQLVSLAEKILADSQGKVSIDLAARKTSKPQKPLTDSLKALAETPATASYAGVQPLVLASLQELMKYVEAAAGAAAKNDNELLQYIGDLEEEVRVHWWVTSGWSGDEQKAFQDLGIDEAAIRAGKELADKHSAALGLFAAPALLDLVVERGRPRNPDLSTLSTAITSVPRLWRSSTFEGVATGPFGDVLPLTAAMGLAASSEDADDWQPRYRRLTGLDPSQKISSNDLGLQVYRECLAKQLLAA